MDGVTIVAPRGYGEPVAARARPLVNHHLDGWLLGGLGVVAWAVVTGYGSSIGPVSGIVSGAFITVAAMHFGASYHLAYGDGWRSVRRHPVALLGVPLALLGAAAVVVAGRSTGHAAGSDAILRVLLVAVFTLTGWHYVKQAFGVGMLAARSRGLKPTRQEALVLRYALYPVWWYDVLEIYERGRSASYGGYDVTVALVPAVLEPVAKGIAIASLALALAVGARLAWRARALPPLGLWGTYLAGGLWFISPPGYVSAAVVLAGLHGVQYLACAHRAEMDLAVERRERNLVVRWLSVFGGAAAGGILLTDWLPDAAGSAFSSAGLPEVLAVLVFVAFNLHHYAVDATIWRSGGDHVIRMSKGPQLAEAVGDQRPGSASEPGPSPAPALA